MRKGLLIFIGILVTAGFIYYIFDINLDSVDYPDILSSDILAWQGNPESTSASGQNPVIINDDWELVWEDDFNQKNLDMEYWTKVDLRDHDNSELQYFTPANARVDGGCLRITANKEEMDGKKYTSAMVQTIDKYSFMYGKIEANISLPKGKGLLPAFWLLPYDGDTEIDIMESVGDDPGTIYGVNHYDLYTIPKKTLNSMKIDRPEQFHVYSMEWNENEIRWYVDGKLYHSTKKGIPHEEMYIIFTLAVGGDWPGSPDSTTVFPCSMAIDYVRVFKKL